MWEDGDCSARTQDWRARSGHTNDGEREMECEREGKKAEKSERVSERERVKET